MRALVSHYYATPLDRVAYLPWDMVQTALELTQELEYRRHAHTAELMLMVAQVAGSQERDLDAYLLPYAKPDPEPPLPMEIARDLAAALEAGLMPQEMMDAIGGRAIVASLHAYTNRGLI